MTKDYKIKLMQAKRLMVTFDGNLIQAKRIPIELKVKTIGNKVIRYKEEQIVNIIKTELD
jgi:hypothetical protein